MIKIFITNLGKYNEGYLIGEWIELPADGQEINELLERIGINDEYEEYFITDYETDVDIEIGEYSSINRLNNAAYDLEGLGDHDLKKYNAMAEAGFYGDHEDRYYNLHRYNLMEGIKNERELGEMILNEDSNIPEYVRGYINYERYGRDIAGGSDGAFTEYGWIERV